MSLVGPVGLEPTTKGFTVAWCLNGPGAGVNDRPQKKAGVENTGLIAKNSATIPVCRTGVS